jgi:hypothetical protein
VLKGSQAEEVGIRSGDIIECFNGERISTTVQVGVLIDLLEKKHCALLKLLASNTLDPSRKNQVF